LTQAILDMEAAYAEIEGREGDPERLNLAGGLLGAILGSSDNPLTAGIYTYTTVVTIWVVGVLTLATNMKVVLQGGNPESVFWQVGSNAAIGTDSRMQGIILAKTNIA
jgi:hypothetical protein